jgi:hypothetical protein
MVLREVARPIPRRARERSAAPVILARGAPISTIRRDARRGVARSLVIHLASLIIGLPLGLFWVFTTIDLVLATDFHPVALFVVGLMWIGPFASLLAVQVGVVMWRARKLDALFVPLGLEGRAYMTHFRRYLGEVSGRQADVRLWRGPVLELEIATTLDTRQGVTEHQADTSFFADLVGKRPLDLAHPDLSNHTVFAMDEIWTRALLSEASTRAAIRRLTTLGSTIFTRQQLLLRPGAMSVMPTGNRRLFSVDITPDQARQWMDDLLAVTEAA